MFTTIRSYNFLKWMKTFRANSINIIINNNITAQGVSLDLEVNGTSETVL